MYMYKDVIALRCSGNIYVVYFNLEQLLEEEKRKAQSVAELMKNPSKVILLQVRLILRFTYH